MTNTLYNLTQPVQFSIPQRPYTHLRWRAWINESVELAALYPVTGDQVTLPAGTWLLEESDEDGVRVFRLASTHRVVLDRDLLPEEAEVMANDQAIQAMQAYQPLDAQVQAWGLSLEHIDTLAPFSLIRCPICGSYGQFASLDFAGVWCNCCNANFYVRHTAGDPGFVVQVEWNNVNYLRARYLLPRTDNLSMHMVFKKPGLASRDPRDMRPHHSCTTETMPLTAEDNSTLRPGLHTCHIGDVYPWRFDGSAPHLGERHVVQASQWQVAGKSWPRSAYLPTIGLPVEDYQGLKQMVALLGTLNGKDGSPICLSNSQLMTAHRLAELLERPLLEQPSVYVPLNALLPPLGELGDDERYMLHHWLVITTDRLPSAWPAWLVVKPEWESRGGEGHWLKGWCVVRDDICTVCGKRVTQEEIHQLLNATGGQNLWRLSSHSGCLKTWKDGLWDFYTRAHHVWFEQQRREKEVKE